MPMNPRLLRPLASGLTDPRKIAGLEAWYDASDLSTLWQNSNGTTAATALDDPVGRWSDKSGNARHVTQTTNACRPLLKPASRNGRATLRMQRSLLSALSVSWNAQLNQGSCVFAVIVPRMNPPVAQFHPCVRFPTSNANALQYESSTLSSPAASANRLEAFVGNTSSTFFRAVPPAAPTNDQLIVLCSQITTTSIELFRNGAVWGAQTVVTGTINSSTSDSLRLNNAIENNSDSGDYDYAEILIYSSSLLTQRKAVERYLCSKWGLAYEG
jgi:hypothetical protein